MAERQRINKRLIDSVKAAGIERLLWDSELLGFGVRVAPTGRLTYVLQYRLDGRQRRYKIGTHGSPWTPETARQEARRLLGAIADGNDPQQIKFDQRAELTVAELCNLYLAEDDLLAALGQWAFEITGRGQPPRLLWDAIAMSVAHRLVDIARVSVPTPSRGGLSGWAQRTVLERLHSGFAEDVTIAELAALADLSPFHFARAFRKSLGVPPRRYLTSLRLAEARRLLTQTTMSVGDIAAAVGYAESSVLARLFRHELAITPTAYRRRHAER